MKRNIIVVSACAVMAVLVSGTAALAELPHRQKVQITYTGTAVPTEIESNPPDGLRAAEAISYGKGTNGDVVGRSLDEAAMPSAPTGVCPAGWLEVPYLASAGVVITQDGSAYFEKMAPQPAAPAQPLSYLCVDPVTRKFTVQITYDIVGGTGRFEGATGRVVTKAAGYALSSVSSAFHAGAPAPAPLGPNRPGLVAFSGSTEGEIVIE